MSNELEVMANRATRMIDALTGVLMGAVESAASRMEQAQQIAAERAQVDMELARLQIRMEAFGSVLETIGVQREVLAQKLSQAKGPLKVLWQRQLDTLRDQELAILARVGIPTETAQQALTLVDSGDQTVLYKRAGSKFLRVENEKLTLADDAAAS